MSGASSSFTMPVWTIPARPTSMQGTKTAELRSTSRPLRASNTATVLLALNGLDVLLSSAVFVPCIEVGLAGMVQTGIVNEEEAPDMAREFAYGRAKRASGFQRDLGTGRK